MDFLRKGTPFEFRPKAENTHLFMIRSWQNHHKRHHEGETDHAGVRCLLRLYPAHLRRHPQLNGGAPARGGHDDPLRFPAPKLCDPALERPADRFRRSRLFCLQRSGQLPLEHHPTRTAFGLVSALGLGLSALYLSAPALSEVLTLNVSQSEPVGLYLRQPEIAPRVGDLISFPMPQTSWAAKHRPDFKGRWKILKAVAGAEGDKVCTNDRHLTINGKLISVIVDRDSTGDTLPHWIDCRPLKAGELFVYSSRIPNSFDSRYYGPINAKVARIYKPFITWGAKP